MQIFEYYKLICMKQIIIVKKIAKNIPLKLQGKEIPKCEDGFLRVPV